MALEGTSEKATDLGTLSSAVSLWLIVLVGTAHRKKAGLPSISGQDDTERLEASAVLRSAKTQAG
jgi:hypothetical protein